MSPGQPPAQEARPAAENAGSDGPHEYISRGYQGAVYAVGRGPGRRVIKTVMGGPLARRLRRYMLRREHAAYQRLAGVEGVPRCYGLEDGERLVLEFVDAQPVREWGDLLPDRDAYFERLKALILALHARGVAHADLKRRDNVLATADGWPVLIDFGAAVLRRESGGALSRALFRLACRIDLNAWIKLKYRRRYDEISTADLAYFRPTVLERAARAVRRSWRKLTGRQQRKARQRRAGSD